MALGGRGLEDFVTTVLHTTKKYDDGTKVGGSKIA